jgi:myo-inositol 2-dehydrogenase/D-chiro-inositol 1-dehydrogenase
VVQIAVVGLGAIGKVHAANLAGRIPGARLARVADASEPALAKVAGVPGSPSYQDVLEDPRVDAVVIATPPSTHPEMVELAAAAGKHIFCEKPLALEVGRAEAAVAAVERSGVLLQLGFHRRFDHDFADARARIASGELGEVRTFFGSMRDMRPPPLEALRSREQTLLHDTACHDLDAARWLVGEIDELTTRGAALASPEIGRLGEVDHAVTLLRFETGALGIIENSLASGYGFDCRCEVAGSKATLRVDRPHLSAIEWLEAGRSGFRRTSTFLERFADAYRRELEAFARAVAGTGDIEVGGEDGLAAVVLANAAERSLRQGVTVGLRRTRLNGAVRYAIDERSEPDPGPPDPPRG